MEFIELKGVPGTPVRARLQDPGAARFQLRLRDLDGTIAKLKTAGSSVVSSGAAPATLNGGIRAAIVPDPNGVFFVRLQAAVPRT